MPLALARRSALWGLFALLFFSGCSNLHPTEATSGPSARPAYELANGKWYIGDGFEAKTMYVAGETLLARRPARVDSVIDLNGGYVVPPFGEAHTHRVSDPFRAEADAGLFIEAGIFYAMNHGNLSQYRDAVDSVLVRSGNLDALFSNALIASPQSHGVELWQRIIGRGVYPDVALDGLDGNAYIIVESSEDVARRWPDVLATRPDFIKVMLEYSEEYAQRRADSLYFGRSGLNPSLIPEIVSRAHDAGLRVSAHVETAADFRVAVAAGADIIAHLPGYDILEEDDVARFRIAPEDARRAATQGTIVMTTTALSADRAEEEPERLARMNENHRQNLRLLSEAGVTLAVASDLFSQNAVDELMNLASLGVFDNATLLDMICRVTPQVIFPDRRIGTLNDGAEASFLVLTDNPIEHLDAVRDITLRVKNGRVLNPS